jgi:hypothetical protein
MRKIYLFTVLLFLPALIFAQGDADINLFVGSPQGDFQDNLDRTAIGINGSIAFAAPSSPIQLGIEMGIMTYGSDSRRESFNPNIPEVQVRVETSYDILTGHFFLRYEVPAPIVRPYIDGLIGFNYLFTETKIQDSQDYDEIASDTNFDDWAFSYGFGPGIKFKVYDSPVNRVYINLKTRYLFGSEASYLQPGSIEVNNGRLTFNESTSKTDMLTIHLGATFKF